MALALGHAAVERYTAAWLETDPHARRMLLDACWAENGVYCDPMSRAEGRAALSELIDAFHQRQPGARIEMASGVDEHDGYLRFAWRMVGADGSVALEGMDVGELDESGALRRIVGFFGPFPSASR